MSKLPPLKPAKLKKKEFFTPRQMLTAYVRSSSVGCPILLHIPAGYVQLSLRARAVQTSDVAYFTYSQQPYRQRFHHERQSLITFIQLFSKLKNVGHEVYRCLFEIWKFNESSLNMINNCHELWTFSCHNSCLVWVFVVSKAETFPSVGSHFPVAKCPSLYYDVKVGGHKVKFLGHEVSFIANEIIGNVTTCSLPIYLSNSCNC